MLVFSKLHLVWKFLRILKSETDCFNIENTHFNKSEWMDAASENLFIQYQEIANGEITLRIVIFASYLNYQYSNILAGL